jgi:hypothetical protein
MWKTISGIMISICFTSNPAMAVDTTWYCSTIFEGAKEPTTLKFEVKDKSLFAFTHVQLVESFFSKYEARSLDVAPLN